MPRALGSIKSDLKTRPRLRTRMPSTWPFHCEKANFAKFGIYNHFNAVPRMDFRNPKNLEAGKREAEATPKQQRDLYDVEKFEKVSATQMSVNPLE